jgi:hypothetical protein
MPLLAYVQPLGLNLYAIIIQIGLMDKWPGGSKVYLVQINFDIFGREEERESPTISTEQVVEEDDLRVGRLTAGFAACFLGIFVFSVLICAEVIPRVTTFDRIFWAVVGAVSLLIAVFLVCVILVARLPLLRPPPPDDLLLRYLVLTLVVYTDDGRVFMCVFEAVDQSWCNCMSTGFCGSA